MRKIERLYFFCLGHISAFFHWLKSGWWLLRKQRGEKGIFYLFIFWVFEVLFATSDFCFPFVYILFAALHIGNGICSMYTGMGLHFALKLLFDMLPRNFADLWHFWR